MTTYSNLKLSNVIDTEQLTISALANGATTVVEFTAGRAYILYKIESSHAAWIRVYNSSEALTSDNGRTQGQDPSITSGVIAEAITTGAETVVFSPAVNGFNDSPVPSTSTYMAITNNSGASAEITVTITKMTLAV